MRSTSVVSGFVVFNCGLRCVNMRGSDIKKFPNLQKKKRPLTGGRYPKAVLRALLGRSLARYLGSFFSSLGKPNRDGLFFTGHFLSRRAAFQRPFFALMHGFLHFGACFFTISGHRNSFPYVLNKLFSLKVMVALMMSKYSIKGRYSKQVNLRLLSD